MYIVTVLVTALVLSLTGLGVLSMALVVNLDVHDAVESQETAVGMESVANVALWRVNSGEDTLATFTLGDYECEYDTTSKELTITSTGPDSSQLNLQLEEDHHFTHAVSTKNSIHYSHYSMTYDTDYAPREYFDFLPDLDESYWLGIADSVYTLDNNTYRDADLIEGILVFTGHSPRFDRIDVENTTMVFTGTGTVGFARSNVVKASYTDSTAMPALVFTDSSSVFFINNWNSSRIDHIEGAIVSKGSILLRRGELTGPIVCSSLTLMRDFSFMDEDYVQYYRWLDGFGAFSDYDWPKQVEVWESDL